MSDKLSKTEHKDMYPSVNVEELTSGADVEDFYKERQKNQFGYKPEEDDGRMLQMQMSNFAENRDKIKIFVIRNEKGEIISGGQVEIEEVDGTLRAYLGDKFVKSEERGKGLAAELTKKRLEVAKEKGCQIAFSLIFKDNFAALRSIMKDGFDISSTQQQPGLEKATKSYFAFRELTTEAKPTTIEMQRVKEAAGRAMNMDSKELVISLSDQASIEVALSSGFVGKYVLNEKDNIPNISSQVMYLERT